MAMMDKLSEFTSETETYQTRYEKICLIEQTFLWRKSPHDSHPLSHKAVTLGWAIYYLSLNLQKSIHGSYRLRVIRTVKKKKKKKLTLVNFTPKYILLRFSQETRTETQ